MRSIPKGTFQRLTNNVALWRAWLDCRRGKRRQPRIAAFDIDADRHVLRLGRELRAGRYRPSPYRLIIVRDPKLRLVAVPEIRDRVTQRALINEIGSSYSRSFIDHSYSCLSGRGPHRAALRYLAWNRALRYRLILDVGSYFASVDHSILLELFDHRLRDRETMDLIAALLASGGAVYRTALAARVQEKVVLPGEADRGLPLGGYLSHWCGDFYLDGLDHFIKRELKIRAYLRYMDDFVLFGNDRQRLDRARGEIAAWLEERRRLRLKDPAAPVRSTGEAATFLGFRISRAGLGPGPKIKRRLREKLRNHESIARLEQSLRSYRGLILSL